MQIILERILLLLENVGSTKARVKYKITIFFPSRIGDII